MRLRTPQGFSFFLTFAVPKRSPLCSPFSRRTWRYDGRRSVKWVASATWPKSLVESRISSALGDRAVQVCITNAGKPFASNLDRDKLPINRFCQPVARRRSFLESLAC